MNGNEPHDRVRDILFGLLAFQLDFIDRPALLAAFAAWTADKSRPLGRVLAEQGAISDDLLILIDGLVAAHLSRHGGEPEKSLAALTPIGPIRKELEDLADPEARACLTQVSAARGGYDPYATNVGSVGVPTSAGVRFQILCPLSKGGMGVVSVALDTELDRSIALKEIREAAADDAIYRARFLAEAEITGKLEHPGIIPIYGLGHYGDGRSFYAMRLIRGDKTGSLMDVIERFYKGPDPSGQAVEFRGLLGRFLDVCNAMAYAHSKGVLHRDLKPDNILLGPYGETLVVDWGLAKAADRDDPVTPADGDRVRLNISGSGLTPTVAGGLMGTPEYAPPEQMVGELSSVGPRSDVYGLGAVLYCLMTGQAPFSRRGIDLGKLIRMVEAGDFPPPRQVRPDADKALEAICLKAMARKPSDRYESVRALAADVENYLADEPVAAYREPRAVRARRWAKRHRTAVTAAAAALVVALAGLGAIAAVQTKARNDLASKNIALDRQRRRAEDREAQAITAVRRFGDVIANEPELTRTPALGGLRKRLLGEPLAFVRALRDSLQADRDTRPESLARLAEASSDLGILTYEIGDWQDALIAYRESLAIRRKLADANPAVTEFQGDLAYSHNSIGLLLRDTGDTAGALKAHESALAIRRKLARAHPESPDFASALGGSLNNIAIIDIDAKRFEEARPRLRQAIECQRMALASNPANPTYRRFLANHLTNLINATRGLGDSEGVVEAERELAKLRDTDPAMVALDARLSAIIAGHQEPKDAADRSRLAQRAYDKMLYAMAARLFAEAIAADPKLGDDRQASHRYNAACAAALACTDQGNDDPRPDEAARAKLRAQALGWLKAERSAWKRVAMTIGPGNKEIVAKTLAHWKQDADLAGIREASALEKLPEAERKDWQALWAEVEDLLAKCRP